MGRPLDEDIIIKILERWQKAFKENSHYVSASDLSLVIKDVRELPTIQTVATDMNVGNNSEIPNSSDAVSRQQAIDEIKTVYEWHDTVTMERLVEHINNLPTVQPETPCYLGSPCEYQNPDVVISQPEPHEGYWIWVAGDLECSKCHTRYPDLYPDYDNSVACPHCGARMKGASE